MRLDRVLILAAPIALLACSPAGERSDRQAADSVFTPKQYSVEELYRNTEYFGASFSPSGDRILVSSNRSGIFNAYVVPTAGGEPQPFTSSTGDAIYAVSFF